MFALYALFLAWAILWKCTAPYIGDDSYRAINLVPFDSNTRWEMEFNLVVFVSFGFLISAVAEKRGIIKLIGVTLLVSLALEAAQFGLAVGKSDVTDLILNTAGGAVGIAAFWILRKLFGRYADKVILTACIAITAFTLYVAFSFIAFGELNLGFMKLRL
jgi:glycopeptide antibiotics resistance protein